VASAYGACVQCLQRARVVPQAEECAAGTAEEEQASLGVQGQGRGASDEGESRGNVQERAQRPEEQDGEEPGKPNWGPQ
jgi:hypothetical protein